MRCALQGSGRKVFRYNAMTRHSLFGCLHAGMMLKGEGTRVGVERQVSVHAMGTGLSKRLPSGRVRKSNPMRGP